MDEKFRQAQRAYNVNGDIQSASLYIKALEQKLGIQQENKRRIALNDTYATCLICEREIEECGDFSETEWISRISRATDSRSDVLMKNPWQAVSMSTSGNYGSQVLDGDSVYFYICDECLIRQSHKMFYTPHQGKDFNIVNASEHFEKWFEEIINSPVHNSPNDSDYLKQIRKYFK